MNVVRLQHAADVGLVRGARAQLLDRRRLVAERFEKRERKFTSIERLFGQG